MDITVDSVKKLMEMKINFVNLSVFHYDENALKINKKNREINNLMLLKSGGGAYYVQSGLDNACECRDGDIFWLPYRSDYIRTNAQPLKLICLDFLMRDDDGNNIERTPQSNISVSELAEQCGLSETSLRTKFRQYTGGMNPIDYRNSLRISKAKELLSATTSSVEMIAETLGFYDSSYFIKVFKHFSDVTPNEYRAGLTKEKE